MNNRLGATRRTSAGVGTGAQSLAAAAAAARSGNHRRVSNGRAALPLLSLAHYFPCNAGNHHLPSRRPERHLWRSSSLAQVLLSGPLSSEPAQRLCVASVPTPPPRAGDALCAFLARQKNPGLLAAKGWSCDASGKATTNVCTGWGGKPWYGVDCQGGVDTVFNM